MSIPYLETIQILSAPKEVVLETEDGEFLGSVQICSSTYDYEYYLLGITEDLHCSVYPLDFEQDFETLSADIAGALSVFFKGVVK